MKIMKMNKEMRDHTADKAEFIKQKFKEEVERIMASGEVGEEVKLVYVWSVALSNISEELAPLFPTRQEKMILENLKDL